MASPTLPKRTAQKKTEADSYAVINYKLGDLGIFRGQTENDYGIDVDLELEQAGFVTGKSVKIQVKSSENLKLRLDGTPSIGGIKQSTLNYWCQIAFRTSVLAYAVDLATEKIYVTADLFWQATKLIDGSAKTKSISFLPEGKDNRPGQDCHHHSRVPADDHRGGGRTHHSLAPARAVPRTSRGRISL